MFKPDFVPVGTPGGVMFEDGGEDGGPDAVALREPKRPILEDINPSLIKLDAGSFAERKKHEG